MKIKIQCKRPKYVSGEYTFSSYEELYNWLLYIKGLAQGGVGAIIYGLADSGYYCSSTARLVIDISIDDKFKKDYRLGSVKEVEVYDGTRVYLRGRMFPTMEVCIYNKKPTDMFWVHTGLPFGFASNRKVKEYLIAVSKHLQHTG